MPQISPTVLVYGRVYAMKAVLAADDSTIIELPSYGPASIVVSPAVGATATVYLTNSSRDDLKAGTANWARANIGKSGVVTANGAMAETSAPLTAFKVEASAGAVTVELLQ